MSMSVLHRSLQISNFNKQRLVLLEKVWLISHKDMGFNLNSVLTCEDFVAVKYINSFVSVL